MKLNPVQKIALSLIQSDARFIYTITKMNSLNPHIKSNYMCMSTPYIGIFADGAEQWGKKVNLPSPKFTEEEKNYYVEMRHAHKLFEYSYDDYYNVLSAKLTESDKHFYSIRSVLEQIIGYKNVGVDVSDKRYCGNTILCAIFLPSFNFAIDGKVYKQFSIIAGKLAAFYGMKKLYPYSVDHNIEFEMKDYNFFSQCPIKEKTVDGFCLFSMLCAINYLLWFVDKAFIDEFPSKLRFLYLQYYYLVNMVNDINIKLNTNFFINNQWYNKDFRDCMAHYGLGKILKDTDIIATDLMGGLTNKLFNTDYIHTKINIFNELKSLANQLEKYLF